MKVLNFLSMSEDERHQLYDFCKTIKLAVINNYEEMCKYWGGVTFDQGENFFTFWEENNIIGTIGVVTREAELRKEIFIAGLNISDNHIDKSGLMIGYVYKICENYKDVSIKLGIKENLIGIVPFLNEQGFNEVYRLYILKLNKDFGMEYTSRVMYETLNNLNIKEFQYINNAAFLNSPNGSSLSDQELEDTLIEYKDKPDYSGIAYINNQPVGIYTLAEKDNIGWIDSIGVKPELHGKGIGKEILYRAIEVLQRGELQDIKLTVMSSNENAFKLYMKHGFEFEGTLSIWYEKKI